MEEEEGGRRLSKRVSEKGGEVDYKDKAGTAWSHSYLNQKPWHPLSYPNQRRKWIAEQTHAQRERRAEEVAREFSQEQEFFRQTALISKKEKEKVIFIVIFFHQSGPLTPQFRQTYNLYSIGQSVTHKFELLRFNWKCVNLIEGMLGFSYQICSRERRIQPNRYLENCA